MNKLIVITGLAVLLTGCADKILSEDHIKDETSIALGAPTNAIVISDRKYDGFATTYYTATIHRVAYRCRIEGGDISSFGMTNPPNCSRL